MDKTKNAHKLLVGTLEGRRPFGRSRSRREDNISIDLKEID
jgi:hypothetical protein